MKQLELLRVGLGVALLASVGSITPHLSALYGDNGWVSHEAFSISSLDAGWYSIFAWCREPAALSLLHAAFLTVVVAFTIGRGVRWVKWPVWLLYVSYLNRNPAVVYGPDLLLANLLLLVCIAPAASGRISGASWPSAPRATACLWLVRWQMAIVFFFTATQKLRGDMWWNGEAVWVVINNAEFAHAPIAGLLSQNVWLVTAATHGALLLELAYPFLIWSTRTRPWILGAAIFFHLATAALFGLYLFAWVAIAGHLSFLPDSALDWIRSRSSRFATLRARRAEPRLRRFLMREREKELTEVTKI